MKWNRIVIVVIVAVIYSFCLFKDRRKLYIIYPELSKEGLSRCTVNVSYACIYIFIDSILIIVVFLFFLILFFYI